jgi:ABC-type transport system involved in cytochrome c biogenesis permease subunit
VATRPFRDLSQGQARFLARALLVVNGLAFALTAAAMVLGGFWAREHMGRFWGWDSRETAALILVTWDLALVVFWWRRPVADRGGVLLGLIGNGVVSLAWFGPALLSTVHSYGARELAVLSLLGFVLAQVALFAAGFAPAGWLRRRAAG